MGTNKNMLLLLLAVYSFYTLSESARILMMPFNHHSHVNFFCEAGLALKDDGHDVYVLTVHQFVSKVLRRDLVPLVHNDKQNFSQFFTGPYWEDPARQLEHFSTVDVFTEILPKADGICRDIGRNKQLMNEIANLNFDLVVNDANIFGSCMYTIPYRFGLKYVSISPLSSPWIFGVSGMPSVEPSHLLSISNRMSFFERLKNTLLYAILVHNPASLLYSGGHLKEFAPHKPYRSLTQLTADSEMVFVTRDVTCVGYPRLSAPDYKFIGVFTTTEAGPLPKDMKDFADGATDGLIVLSFGSFHPVANAIKYFIEGMLNVISRLPQRAIIQYAPEDEIDHPANVKLVKWLPQNDLLGHPNTKVFITHGGNNGQHEAIYHGVPVLTIPFGLDQQFNAIQAESKGFGLILERSIINEETFGTALAELIHNNSYVENVKKCSDIMKSKPSARESLVYWVNHVLRFGANHLHSSGRDMPLHQLLMVDVLAFVFAVTFVSIASCVCCCQHMCKRRNKTRKDKKE